MLSHNSTSVDSKFQHFVDSSKSVRCPTDLLLSSCCEIKVHDLSEKERERESTGRCSESRIQVTQK